MSSTNLQIRVPEEVIHQINKISRKSKSAFVREALEEKIHRELDRQQEQKWIDSLKKHPEDLAEAEAWLRAEGWGDK